MNRPRKKRLRQLPGNQEGFEKRGRLEGWNTCCDEWEKFMPNEKELLKIMLKYTCNSDLTCRKLAKAISERLRGDV